MTNHKSQITNHLVSSLLLLLVISIPTSKAGMNIFAPLLALICLFHLPLNIRALEPLIKKTFVFCIVAFFIGIVGSLFISPNIEDIRTYAQKNIYLLVIPIALHSITRNNNSKLYIYGFISACIIASLASFWKLTSINFDGLIRVTGFIDFSRHNNSLLLAMSFCFALINRNNARSFLWTIPIIIFSLSILISGTRGGWLGALAVIGFSIIFYHRYMLIPTLTLTLVAILSASYIAPNVYHKIEERAVSIVNTKSDLSNNERINTWRSGIEYIQYVASEHKDKLIFGSGMESTDTLYREYMFNLEQQKLQPFLTHGKLGGGTDFHNGIIDVIIKSGLLFFVFITAGFIVTGSFSLHQKTNTINKSFVIYSLSFLVTLPFYSLLQDYSILTMSLIIPLTLSEYLLQEDKHNES